MVRRIFCFGLRYLFDCHKNLPLGDVPHSIKKICFCHHNQAWIYPKVSLISGVITFINVKTASTMVTGLVAFSPVSHPPSSSPSRYESQIVNMSCERHMTLVDFIKNSMKVPSWMPLWWLKHDNRHTSSEQ